MPQDYDVIEQVEALIAKCMRAQGFEYVAVDAETVRRGMAADKTLPGLEEREFIARYGGEPEFAIFDQADNAMKRMRTGLQVDLVHLCTGQMAEALDAGLIKPLEIGRIPRWGDIPAGLLELKDVRIDGQFVIAPWEWGYSTVGYNPEVIDVENPTYEIFIDPRFKGKTALTSDIGVNLIIAGVIVLPQGWFG